MPEYRCQNCGAIWYGWGVFSVCRWCGGTLKATNETAKKREIYEKQEAS